MNPVVFLPLSQGKVAVIDFDDFEKVGRVKWYAHKWGNTFYAIRNVHNPSSKSGRSPVRLHCVLLGVEGIDHINGDGLDNRRENLRPATPTQNQQNRVKHKKASSEFKGVSWDKENNKWRAHVWVEKKQTSLGRFLSEVEAAQAYDSAARKFFGDFAKSNFLGEPLQSEFDNCSDSMGRD